MRRYNSLKEEVECETGLPPPIDEKPRPIGTDNPAYEEERV